jgi:hypothetical protein
MRSLITNRTNLTITHTRKQKSPRNPEGFNIVLAKRKIYCDSNLKTIGCFLYDFT